MLCSISCDGVVCNVVLCDVCACNLLPRQCICLELELLMFDLLQLCLQENMDTQV